MWVYPVVDDRIDIEINEADLKVDTYRASGAGGQHVNKTESAIRITHVPSGIIVACQTDRSQHRNRAMAMAMLKARLYEAELQRREAVSAAQEDAKTDIGWGHQIRNYVLAPYQLVKDLRTGVEKGNPDAVLDGDLDEFMAAALAARVRRDAQRGERVGALTGLMRDALRCAARANWAGEDAGWARQNPPHRRQAIKCRHTRLRCPGWCSPSAAQSRRCR